MANADQIIDLLHEAKARPAGGMRERFLAEACGNDADLKAQIESLLAAGDDERESDFLKVTRLVRPAVQATEKPGDRIGRYTLLEQIGEGGCGVVYMAEQEEPVRRRVVLKVIKLGMDTKQVIARFEAERQALAMMDHPNIAKVLDGGATDAGRPFFVMELVRGVKITDYCDDNNLPTRERLQLFMQVCHAIQHAHQKGIIHRDIKPSNILVTQHDHLAVTKVIDFGIAKATTGQLRDKTVFTAFAQFIGTPAYMSPEQAHMSGLDVDTRADIYSLGVLLYELLTGYTPFDGGDLLAAGMDEMRRKLREEEPAKPSTCLSIMQAKDLTAVAKRRHAEPPKLIHQIRGDLDWLVMKCLEKDRSRRYETASGLAMDIQRHLSNEPVIARPPSFAYRLQKLVSRHRFAFAATGAASFALVAGVTATIYFLMRENASMSRARQAEQWAAAERLRSDRAAGAMTQNGTAYLKRGDVEEAEKWLLEALALRRSSAEGGERQAAEILGALANLRHSQREYGEADRLARESVAILRRLRTNDPILARTLNFLADSRYELGDLPGAEVSFREALAVTRRSGIPDPDTLQWSLYALAETLERQNKFAEAESLYRELLALPNAGEPVEDGVLSPSAGITRCLMEQAWMEHGGGESGMALTRAREAESLLRAALTVSSELSGRRVWQTAEIRNRLGDALLLVALTDPGIRPEARAAEFAKAETLLLESGLLLRHDPAVHSNFKRDALGRLVRLYTHWNAAAPGSGKAEEAAVWRQQLASHERAAALKSGQDQRGMPQSDPAGQK